MLLFQTKHSASRTLCWRGVSAATSSRFALETEVSVCLPRCLARRAPLGNMGISGLARRLEIQCRDFLKSYSLKASRVALWYSLFGNVCAGSRILWYIHVSRNAENVSSTYRNMLIVARFCTCRKPSNSHHSTSLFHLLHLHTDR